MRHINLASLNPSPEWLARAEEARLAVLALGDSDRAACVRVHSSIWSELKRALEKLSNKKCWYCEAIQERSDKHVDHFRPKNRVCEKNCEDHPGYWWLAFDWHNFRYSCTYCNSRRVDQEGGTAGGKHDRFPILDEARRCRRPEDVLADEQPVLLDPTVDADAGLLWFDEDGKVHSAPSAPPDSWPHRRAEESVELYHLHHVDIVEARRRVALRCKELVAEVDAAWPDYRKGSPVAESKFKESVRRLMEMMASEAEYSAAARCTVMGLRSGGRPWLDVVLQAA